MFHVWIRVFTASTIEPPLDNMGDSVYPDLECCFDEGLFVKPVRMDLRFVERSSRLI